MRRLWTQLLRRQPRGAPRIVDWADISTLASIQEEAEAESRVAASDEREPEGEELARKLLEKPDGHC